MSSKMFPEAGPIITHRGHSMCFTENQRKSEKNLSWCKKNVLKKSYIKDVSRSSCVLSSDRVPSPSVSLAQAVSHAPLQCPILSLQRPILSLQRPMLAKCPMLSKCPMFPLLKCPTFPPRSSSGLWAVFQVTFTDQAHSGHPSDQRSHIKPRSSCHLTGHGQRPQVAFLLLPYVTFWPYEDPGCSCLQATHPTQFCLWTPVDHVGW